MMRCQTPAYRAQYRLRRRPITRIRLGPWEVHYDAREMWFYYEGQLVGEKIMVSREQLPNAGSSKAAKYLIGRIAQAAIVKCVDLHERIPFDPTRFPDVFAWRATAGSSV